MVINEKDWQEIVQKAQNILRDLEIQRIHADLMLKYAKKQLKHGKGREVADTQDN